MKQKKKHSDKVVLIVDEELNKLKGTILAPKKLEETNEFLRNLKTPLPKV